MQLAWLLFLQADDLGKKAQGNQPGLQSGFSKAAILTFLVLLVIAVALAVRMIARGTHGVSTTKSKRKKESNEN